MIPVRIDEARRSLPNIDARSISDAEFIVADTSKDLERIEGLHCGHKSAERPDEL